MERFFRKGILERRPDRVDNEGEVAGEVYVDAVAEDGDEYEVGEEALDELTESVLG